MSQKSTNQVFPNWPINDFSPPQGMDLAKISISKMVYYIILLCTPTWPPYPLTFESRKIIEYKSRIAMNTHLTKVLGGEIPKTLGSGVNTKSPGGEGGLWPSNTSTTFPEFTALFVILLLEGFVRHNRLVWVTLKREIITTLKCSYLGITLDNLNV